MTNKPNMPLHLFPTNAGYHRSVSSCCERMPIRNKAHPPDGANEFWWARLNKALGTVSRDFVRRSLLHLQSAARSPFGTISEIAINGALAMISAAAPKDEIEGALAVQMSCTHAAAMAILGKLDSGFGTERRIAIFASAAARLMRTFAMQVEVFRRLRNGGQQFVRVEHVHVNEGGQAVIGNVKPASSHLSRSIETMAAAIELAAETQMET